MQHMDHLDACSERKRRQSESNDRKSSHCSCMAVHALPQTLASDMYPILITGLSLSLSYSFHFNFCVCSCDSQTHTLSLSLSPLQCSSSLSTVCGAACLCLFVSLSLSNCKPPSLWEQMPFEGKGIRHG